MVGRVGVLKCTQDQCFVYLCVPVCLFMGRQSTSASVCVTIDALICRKSLPGLLEHSVPNASSFRTTILFYRP